jgi:2,4-dienoyl-CoA reductase (NADPH2)
MKSLKNKFILAPLKFGYTTNGLVNKIYLLFYEKRSHDIGAITPEPFYLDPGLREIPSQLGIDSDNKIHGLTPLVNLLHKNGAKAIAHLNQSGRMANMPFHPEHKMPTLYDGDAGSVGKAENPIHDAYKLALTL